MLIALSFCVLSIAAFAQRDTIKVREVGLVFSNINSFGLCYKFGNENTLFRITALSLTGANNAASYNTYSYNGVHDTVPSSPSSSFGVGLNFGFEKRKPITDRFYFYYGLVLINSYTESNSNSTTPSTSFLTYWNANNVFTVQSVVLNSSNAVNTWNISSGLGVVLGVAYKLNKSFSIEVELIPSISYNYGDSKTTTNSNIVELYPSGKGYEPQYFLNVTNQDKTNKGISYSVLNNNAAITIAYKIK